MQILYIITGLTVGGAERITIDLAERMVKLGNKVTFIYLSGRQEFPVSSEINLINLEMKKSPLGFIKALKKCASIVKEFEPDVVHSNMFHANFFARMLRIFVTIPKLICTEHTKNMQSKLRMKLLGITDFLCDITTNVSQEATDYLIEKKVFNKKKSMAVYNGIDLSKFVCKKDYEKRNNFGIKKSDFLFVNVSRLMPAKDHENLIHAFKIVHDSYQNTQLICVGDGPEREKIQNLINNLQLNDSIFLLGSQTNVVQFYDMSDCFVLSSAWEGFGIVLAEAMACELPVISTDCGGTREVVQNMNFLVDVHNSAALAEKMTFILNLSEDDRQKIGAENRKLTEKFDLNFITNKWLDLYQNSYEGLK